MRRFDYSFLQELSLPEGLASLCGSIRSMNSDLSFRMIRRANAYAPAPGMETVLADTDNSPVSAASIMRIHNSLIPEGRYADEASCAQVEQAAGAYERAIASGIFPLLAAPCLAIDLICLSPFTEAPVDTALLLTQILLYRSGYDICRYCFLLEEGRRYNFFLRRSIKRASAHWTEGANEYLPFIEQLLSLLYLSLKDIKPVKKRKSPSAGQRPTKRARICSLVLSSVDPISKADICAALPDISPTTIEMALGAMVKSGTIRRIGASRASKYIKATPHN